MFYTSTRSCARADDAKIVRSRDAQRNTYILLDVLLCSIADYFFPSGHGNEFCNLIGS